MTDSATPVSPVPHRWALFTWFATMALIGFGALITTTGAGMAVQGWWNAEGHFMPLFPVDKWTRDAGTFVEHTHRLIGMVVGFGALLTAITTWRTFRGGRPFLWALIAVVAVIVQGTLGGFRVLENSPNLAFLHGVTAQLVFALIGGAVLATQPRPEKARAGIAGPKGLALLVVLAVLAQSTLGARYRHEIRPEALRDTAMMLHQHIAGAVIVFVAVGLLAKKLKALADAAAPARGWSRRLHVALGLQVLLGLAAWMANDLEVSTATMVELVVTTGHVLIGAVLLSTALEVCLWLSPGRAGSAQPTAQAAR
jgi:cytochrome c oxidase assembly protein subunit 15